MLAFLTPVSALIGISNADVAAIGVFTILAIVLAALGSARAYSAFYGAVIGIGIYVVLQTLLAPAYQTAGGLFGPKVSEFLTGSSAYLIPILFLLSVVNAPIRLPTASNPALRFGESFLVAAWSLALVVAVALGFSARTYVFTADTAFTLLSKSQPVSDFLSQSKAVAEISTYLREIVLVSILFAIYKAFFSEIVSGMVGGLLKSAFKRKGGGGHSHEEVSHGHDVHDMEEAYEAEEHYHDAHSHH
jgi:hypothetical protein